MRMIPRTAAPPAQTTEVDSGHNGGAQNMVNMTPIRQRRKAILDIVDPKTGKKIGEEIHDDNNSTCSGDSNNRVTLVPQVHFSGAQSPAYMYGIPQKQRPRGVISTHMVDFKSEKNMRENIHNASFSGVSSNRVTPVPQVHFSGAQSPAYMYGIPQIQRPRGVISTHMVDFKSEKNMRGNIHNASFSGVSNNRAPPVPQVHFSGAQDLLYMNAILQRERITYKAVSDIVVPKTGKNIHEDAKDNATPSGDCSNPATPRSQVLPVIPIQSKLSDRRSLDYGNTTPPAKLNRYDYDHKELTDALNVKKIDKPEPIPENDQASQITSKRPLLLKYTYRADQWSPLNRSGKKVYDRDFLIKLQSDPSSNTKPLNLPNLAIVLKISRNNCGSISPKQFQVTKVYDRDFLIKLQSDPSSNTRPLNLPNLDIVLKDNSRIPPRQFKDVGTGKQGSSLSAAVVRSSQSPLRGPIMRCGKKEQSEEDHKPTAVENSSSIAITARPKQELVVEEAECTLAKKHSESSVSPVELNNGMFIFLDKHNCFSCPREHKLSMEQIHIRLLCIMSDEKENSFDKIWIWIFVNVGKRVREREFIRVLMTAILEISIEPHNYKWEFRPDKFQKLQALIPPYINSNIELSELECLVTIQEYIHKLEHPSGVLLQIIEKLWDDSILSTDALLAWESNKDPTALAGKSVAMMALTSFFTFLKAYYDESSGEEE